VFGAKAPKVKALTRRSYDLDRPLLARLERASWEAVTERVRQAYFDRALGTLNIAICTADSDVLGQPTSFDVTNLAPGVRYRVILDGAESGDWEMHGETLRIRTQVGSHTCIVQPCGSVN
jgi:hypothetical protein